MGDCAVWGSELSPFVLKLRALLDSTGIPYRWLPDQGTRFENLITLGRLRRAKARRAVQRYPTASPLDEYPLVPFLVEDGRRFHHDSSALARWLDAHPERRGLALFPEAQDQAFLAQLLDEFFDEFGLYLVHHKRWVDSAATNDAGSRLAGEMRTLLPGPLRPILARRFSERQVRRLPYLFSVAPEGYDAGVDPALTPPSRAGFPATHDLLDEVWEATLTGMEAVLTRQPFLLGERFTVADASAYGQLGMNLTDPTAAENMRERAPATTAWLENIRDRRHIGTRGATSLSAALRPLLGVVMRTFAPLMQQNESAYERARTRGAARFNEAAFDRGEALYDGELIGHRFRSVAKSFQVRVWRDLRQTWRTLPEADRKHLESTMPGCDYFDAAESRRSHP